MYSSADAESRVHNQQYEIKCTLWDLVVYLMMGSLGCSTMFGFGFET